MNETADIELNGLLIIYGMMVIPLIVFFYYKIPLIKKQLTGMIRMSIQLTLVGIYLKYIFDINNLFLTSAWVIVMIIVANVTTLNNAHLQKKKMFWVTFTGIFLSTVLVTAIFVFIAIRPSPIYDAQYLIPIAGMILGNCLRSNIIGLERFYYDIFRNEKEFTTYLLLGATVPEACLPYMRRTLIAALSPTLSTMATMGIVSLPGMMTGQILGGASPLVAIKYQIGIMGAIFVSTTLAVTINILLSIRFAFDEYGRLNRSYLKKTV